MFDSKKFIKNIVDQKKDNDNAHVVKTNPSKTHKHKLYYLYIELPVKVRLVSRTLGLDHIIYPRDNSYYDLHIECNGIPISKECVGIKDLFNLSNTNLFDNIYCYVDEDNKVYYFDEQTNEKKEIIGCFDIIQFVDGEHLR